MGKTAAKGQRRSRLSVGFPLLGKVEGLGYLKQPPLTTPGSRNVVPFDVIEQRGRGGQRAGLRRYFPTQVNGANRVQSLRQATRVLSSLAVLPGDLLLDETFNGAAGSTPETLFPGVWQDRRGTAAYPTFPNPVTTGVTPGLIEYATNGVEVLADYAGGAPAVVDNRSDSILKSRQGGPFALDVADSYVVRVTISTDSTYAADTAAYMGIFFRFRVTAPLDGFMLAWHKITGAATYQISLLDETGTVLANSGSLGNADDANHILELRVNKNFVEGYWDQVRRVIFDLTGQGADNTAGPAANDNNQHIGLFQARQRAAGVHTNTNRGRFDNFQVYTAVPPPVLRENKIIAVSAGEAYIGSAEDGIVAIPKIGGTTPSLDANTTLIEAVSAFQRVFLLDGSTYRYVDLANGSATLGNVVVWNGTAGAPVQPIPGGNGSVAASVNSPRCRFGVLHGGRLYMSGKADEASAVFGCRIGAPDDWDFGAGGAPATDEAAAFDTGASLLGDVPDVVMALMSFRGTQLVIGGAKSMNAIIGNPRSQDQSLTERRTIAQDIGIVGARAWCMGKDLRLYWLSIDGLYGIGPNQFNVDRTQGLSNGRVAKSLQDVDYATTMAQLMWNFRQNGVDIFLTQQASGLPSTHFFWSLDTGGFYEIGYPDDHGPTAILSYDTDSPADRARLLGGFDGYVRAMSEGVLHDDFTAIESSVLIGPILSPWPDRAFLITNIVVVTDTATGGLEYDVLVGPDPQTALAAEPSFSGTLAPGRNSRIWDRARGNAAFIRLRNKTFNTTWALERIDLEIREAGPSRAATAGSQF